MFKVLNGNGIFAHKFISTVEKLNFNLKKEDLYSSLNDENLSEEDFCYYLIEIIKREDITKLLKFI